MSWIKTIEQADADEELRRSYEEVGAARGEVVNVLKLHSLRPRVMSAHLALYRELMFGRSELSRTEREMLAVEVSVINKCHY